MNFPYRKHCVAGLAAVLFAFSAQAATSTKDVVLERVTAPPVNAAPAAVSTDAMVVSVLLESPDGTLAPKSTETLFHTGDRFRIKVIASRDAKLSIYNTTPRGEFKPEPVWQGQVTVGQETITPRLELTNDSGAGIEQLHLVLEPTAASGGLIEWIRGWFADSKGKAAGQSKDVRLDTQSTPVATYSLNTSGQGIVNTIRIAHH